MESKTVNNPSTEGKAPVSTITSGTAATSTSGTTPATSAATSTPSTAATSTANNTPATAQIINGTTQASTTQTNTTATATPAPPAQNAAATLLDDYLKSGYFRGEDKKRYTDPALVSQAEAIGKALAQSGVPANAVKKMFRTLKTAARLPYEAQQGALKKLTPQVLDLEHRKKAPTLLREVVERNQRAVQNEADYRACLDHIKDIGVFLEENAQG